MLFAEALQALKEGKDVARESWEEKEGFLKLVRGMKHVWKIMPYPNPNAGNHVLSVEELEADDWKVL